MKTPELILDRVLIVLTLSVGIVGLAIIFVLPPLLFDLLGFYWQPYSLIRFLAVVGFVLTISSIFRLVRLRARTVKTEEWRLAQARYRRAYLVATIIAVPFVWSGFILGTMSISEKSPVGAASGDIGAFNSALALYLADLKAKTYPTTMDQLLTDNAPGWSGPYLATIGADPWGNAYTYTGGASNYTIISIHYSIYHKSETVRYIRGEGILSTLP